VARGLKGLVGLPGLGPDLDNAIDHSSCRQGKILDVARRHKPELERHACLQKQASLARVAAGTSTSQLPFSDKATKFKRPTASTAMGPCLEARRHMWWLSG